MNRGLEHFCEESLKELKLFSLEKVLGRPLFSLPVNKGAYKEARKGFFRRTHSDKMKQNV